MMTIRQQLHLPIHISKLVVLSLPVLMLVSIGCSDNVTTASPANTSSVTSPEPPLREVVSVGAKDLHAVSEPSQPGNSEEQISSRSTTQHDASPVSIENLSGELTFDPEARYVIVHADDAGMCHSVNRGTIEALEAGVVKSASIMVPCPAFDEFARYARLHPEYDYGIHLTLNAEFKSYRWGPVLPANEVPSLVDGGGKLWRSEQEVAGNARSDDVERELKAQIEKALNYGVRLTHLDSHMGTLFMRPDLLDIYVRLGIEYNLPVLVPEDNRFLREMDLNGDVISQLDASATALRKHGLPVVDRVLMHYRTDSVSRKRRAYTGMIRSIPAGVSEIIIHCGYADSELRSITRSSGIRDGDRRVFIDPAVIREFQDSNLKLITWQQFHQFASQRTRSY